MRIARRMDKLAGLEIAHLRNHHRKQRIRRNVEGHAEEQIAAALVELQAQAVLLALFLRREAGITSA